MRDSSADFRPQCSARPLSTEDLFSTSLYFVHDHACIHDLMVLSGGTTACAPRQLCINLQSLVNVGHCVNGKYRNGPSDAAAARDPADKTMSRD